jgi:hypothetical protein
MYFAGVGHVFCELIGCEDQIWAREGVKVLQGADNLLVRVSKNRFWNKRTIRVEKVETRFMGVRVGLQSAMPHLSRRSRARGS